VYADELLAESEDGLFGDGEGVAAFIEFGAELSLPERRREEGR